MALSRALLVTLAMLATGALACDALLGLDAYSDVDGSTDSGEAASDDASDASMDMTTPDGGPVVADAADAGDAADVTDGDAGDAPPIFDGAFDGLPPTAYWARWPMPNPDAAIAPGADAMLPNPMSYAGGGDASATAVDRVTNLTWSTAASAASDYAAAVMKCQQMGPGWHVPTRIELVSLIDFTQIPTIDNATFPGTLPGTYWTASMVPVDAATPEYWVVDFSSGLTVQDQTASYVRCVQGGT
jgi:hypothetical protein